jgi:branched-chain amino acid aminotransferase
VVRTFEIEGGSLRRSWTDDTLAAASASLPEGAYTVLRTYGGTRVLGLARHVARLEESLSLQGRAGGLSLPAARRALAMALRACGHAESRVRVTLAPPRLFVSVEAFRPLPEALYREGVSCVTLPLRRDNPHAKDTHFIAAAVEAYAGLPPGTHEGLLVSEAGEILEGLSSNFFGVARGVLRTEGQRVLEGLTRSQVLELARGVMDLSFDAVGLAEIGSLDEAFLTSASRGVLPVTRIDGATVGSGRPGPFTSDLGRRYEALTERESESVVD